MMANTSLLKWLSTFELDGQPPVELKDDAYYNLADGYVCARILNQISPQYFSDTWLSGIKPVPPNGSWRLRVSNLKRILQKIHDYGSDLQSPQFKTSTINPDVAVIAQNFDPDQISRLIQLILFCAINCDKKQYFIEKIHDLPTQVKQDIKEAIEELLVKSNDGLSQRVGTGQADIGQADVNSSFRSTTSVHNLQSPSKSTPNRSAYRRDSSQISNETSRLSENNLDGSMSQTLIEEIKQRLNEALVQKDEKAQACHDLEFKLKQLQLDRDQLAQENERLVNQKSQADSVPESRRQSGQGGNLLSDRDIKSKTRTRTDDNADELILAQNKKLLSEINRLKDDIIKIESEKEEFRLKSSLLQEDIDMLTARYNELKDKAEQVKRLQDELDEHRQISVKIVNYETTIENLVKKNNDLKREMKVIEEKNLENVQNMVRLKEENNQLNVAISRIDLYKKQLHEIQMQLGEERHRADKAELELSRVTEKCSALNRDNERLYRTTNQLLESNNQGALKSKDDKIQESLSNDYLADPLRGYASVNLTNEGTVKNLFDPSRPIDDHTNSPTFDLKERLARLEVENELLQSKLMLKRNSDNAVMNGLLENSAARCTKLESENRQLMKRILLLESRLKDLTNSQGGPSTSAISAPDLSSDNIFALNNRVEELQRLLFQKDQELMESAIKYRKNTQKAKELIRTLNSNQSLNGGSLHPSCMSSTSSFNSSSLDENNLLKQQLKDREDRLIELEREFSEFKRLKEVHERLILTAFYGLTTPIQRRNAEKRLERTTLTSPTNVTSSLMSHNKHSH